MGLSVANNSTASLWKHSFFHETKLRSFKKSGIKFLWLFYLCSPKKNSLAHLLFSGDRYYGSKQKVTGLMSFSPGLCDTAVMGLATPRDLLAARRGGTHEER